MGASTTCRLLGPRRIVETDSENRGVLDLIDPTDITFEAGGYGQLSFGAALGGRELQYGKHTVFVPW
jgi:hypothetical protein